MAKSIVDVFEDDIQTNGYTSDYDVDSFGEDIFIWVIGLLLDKWYLVLAGFVILWFMCRFKFCKGRKRVVFG